MPTYVYECAKCGDEFEIWQSITDDTLKRHGGSCRGRLAKVIQPAGIVLKGSGFYKNDSRSGSKRGKGSGSSDTTSGESTSSEAPAKASSSSDSSSSSSGSSDSGGSSSDNGSSSSGSNGSSNGSASKKKAAKTGSS